MNKLALTTTVLLAAVSAMPAMAQREGGDSRYTRATPEMSTIAAEPEDSRAKHRGEWRRGNERGDDEEDRDDRRGYHHGDREWRGRDHDRRDGRWSHRAPYPEYERGYRYDYHRDYRHGYRDDYRWAEHRYRAPVRYVYPRGYGGYSWRVGSRLPPPFYTSGYYVDYRYYGLMRPPYGYQWVRIDNDVVLVAISSGLIRDVLYGLFR